MHIVQNAIDLAILLGVEKPKVAVLSAVEVVNPAIPSTIDAACLAKMADRGQITGAIIDGPLAFDNAISAESAKVKGIKSLVSGDVDILVVPDLVSGNILGKDLEYLASAQMAGLVVGTKVPIILTSRSDPPRTRLLSCAVAVLASHRME
jgi:phosphate butyryltransferase